MDKPAFRAVTFLISASFALSCFQRIEAGDSFTINIPLNLPASTIKRTGSLNTTDLGPSLTARRQADMHQCSTGIEKELAKRKVNNLIAR
jgi:hypothetical protein